MDLNKIIKIEKGGGTTTFPPFKASTDKVLEELIKKV